MATDVDPADPAHVVDRRIVAFVRDRQGVVTTPQLDRIGVTRTAIRSRVRRGWLIRRHSGVYLVGSLTGPFSEQMAAVMAIGDDARLSVHAAAAIWRMRAAVGGPVDVSVVGRHARSRPGIRVHNVRALEHTIHHGIPVTTPAWTLLDLAVTLGAADLARTVEEARVLRLARPPTSSASRAGLVARPSGRHCTSSRASPAPRPSGCSCA